MDFNRLLLDPVAEFELTRDEVRRGAIGGFRRWEKSKGHKRKGGGAFAPFRDLELDAVGAVAEVAVAKWVGIPLSQLKIREGTYKDEPDLPPDLEVKFTTSKRMGLLLRVGDQKIANRKFVLVTNSDPGLFQIWGWAYGWQVLKYGEKGRPDPKRDECFILSRGQLCREKP